MVKPEQEKKVDKLEQIDVLRGLAILFVFFYHWHLDTRTDYVRYTGGAFLSLKEATFDQLYGTFSPFQYGAIGVQLFLVISGFLIHYNYLVRGPKNFSVKQFYLKRFWRIYPTYLLVMLLLVFINRESSIYYLFNPVGQMSFVAHLLMVHNLFPNQAILFGINSSFWTLGLEWQLYLIYPLLLFFLKKVGSLKRLCLYLFFVHIAAVCLIIFIRRGFPDNIAYYTFVFHYWVVWVLGALVAEGYYYRKPVFNASWGLIIFLSLTFYFSLIFIFFFHSFSHVFAAIIFALLVEKVIFTEMNLGIWGGFWKKIMINIGLCSYSIYLIHQPLMGPFLRHIDFLGLSNRTFPLVNGIIIFIIIFCLSWGMYTFIELNSVKLGRRLATKGKPAAVKVGKVKTLEKIV